METPGVLGEILRCLLRIEVLLRAAAGPTVVAVERAPPTEDEPPPSEPAG